MIDIVANLRLSRSGAHRISEACSGIDADRVSSFSNSLAGADARAVTFRISTGVRMGASSATDIRASLKFAVQIGLKRERLLDRGRDVHVFELPRRDCNGRVNREGRS